MQAIVSEFTKGFRFTKNNKARGIGIECELPVVTHKGEAVGSDVIQDMFLYLERKGFVLRKDSFSGLFTVANKINTTNLGKYNYDFDSVTTDVGYAILELVLAPQDNLYDIQTRFSELLLVLITYFDHRSCLILGYGIQPVTPPSSKLLMSRERYCFFKKFSYTNYIVSASQGVDADLLTITASNQCHIEIELEDAVRATNVLNALSGLQIALHSNSPIWNGRIDAVCKTNREIFWEQCFTDRRNQIGIPPKFKNIEAYVSYLLDFKPLLVKRAGKFLKIENKKTFYEFLFGKTATIATNLQGNRVSIEPDITDMQYLIPFSWFNARLVPRYGTIESRMCCQQPPNETLTSVALTLGLIENLENSEKLMNRFSLQEWQDLRSESIKKAFCVYIDGKPIISLLRELLDIAKEGLKKRNLCEELFLEPLYRRLESQASPGDTGIEVFRNGGIKLFLDFYSFKKEHCIRVMKNTSISQLKDDMV